MGRTYDSSKEQIYKIYKNLFQSDIQYGKKKDILRSLFVGEKWTWKVVKISKNVVLECKEKEFKKPPRRFERHHPDKFEFANTASFLLKGHLKTIEEWNEFLDNHEKTYLLTKEEHSDWENIYSDIILYDVNPDSNLFLNTDRGWHHGKAEEKFLKNLFIKMKL